jgi:hypothetical protein
MSKSFAYFMNSEMDFYSILFCIPLSTFSIIIILTTKPEILNIFKNTGTIIKKTYFKFNNLFRI